MAKRGSWSSGILATAALALALGLAGCGGGGNHIGTVLQAARTTLAQRVSLTMTVHGASLLGARAHAATGQAAFDFAAALGYEATNFPASGTVFFDFLPSAVYLQPFARTGLQGRAWLELPLEASGARAPSPALLELLEAFNPAFALSEIVDGAVSVRSVGTRVIAHTPYAAYDVTVDLRRALAAATSSSTRPFAGAIRGELAAAGSAGTVTIMIWVNGPGQIGELEAAFPGTGLGTLTFILANFGTPVPRNIPVSSQLLPFAELSGGSKISPADVLAGTF